MMATFLAISSSPGELLRNEQMGAVLVHRCLSPPLVSPVRADDDGAKGEPTSRHCYCTRPRPVRLYSGRARGLFPDQKLRR